MNAASAFSLGCVLLSGCFADGTCAAMEWNSGMSPLATNVTTRWTKSDWKDWAKLADLEAAATNGEPAAQFRLAVLYYTGTGVPQDFAQAAKWFREATDWGWPEAQFDLGLLYENGQGVEKDEAEAARWYVQAATLGYGPAQNNLGQLYQYGRGVRQDYAEAFKLYHAATTNGLTGANNNLGWLYEHGLGTSLDFGQAARCYRLAAEQGIVGSQYNLGTLCESGRGVKQDYVEAAKWYRKAAEQNYAPAEKAFGLCYENGRGVSKDREEAIKWFRKAALQNYGEAEYELARLLPQTGGTVGDLVEAYAWATLAIDQNEQYAGKLRDVLAANMSRDQLAAGQLMLAQMYHKGVVVQRDLSKAMAFAEDATAGGNAQAHALCGVMADAEAQDRIWIPARINGRDVRLVFDSGSPNWMLFSGAAKRLGIKTESTLTNVVAAHGGIQFAQSEECALEVWGTAVRTRFVIVGTGEDYGLCGWSPISANIFKIDASSREVFGLQGVPGETASWLKFGVDTNAGHLVLEVPLEGTGIVGIGIDTGDRGGVSLDKQRWGQWAAKHPKEPLTFSSHVTLGARDVAVEEGWADRISFGALVLTNVPVTPGNLDETFPGTRKCVAALGMAALKHMDLIVDGPRGVAYVRLKPGPFPPFQHNRLGAIFVPGDPKSDSLIARVTKGGPAYDAGIRDGDALLKMGEVDATGWRENEILTEFVTLWNRPAGTKFDLGLGRGKKTFTTAVVLRNLLPPESADSGAPVNVH